MITGIDAFWGPELEYDKAINVSSAKNLTQVTYETYIVHLNDKSLLKQVKSMIV